MPSTSDLEWAAGTVLSSHPDQLTIKVGASTMHCAPCDVSQRDSHDNSAYSNLLLLPVLSEPEILQSIHRRFSDNSIYTFAGSMLVSVNPFKQLDIYGDTVMDAFRTNPQSTPASSSSSSSSLLSKTPHIYSIAATCYHRMLMSSSSSCPADQSIVISGESGAGKTESTRHILSYLTHAAATLDPIAPGSSHSVMQKIMASNPILHAFGNAKTTRNDNSSRFGKFIELFYDKTGHLIGGLIKSYLIERVRVCRQQKGERNFHIFYQLLTASRNKTNEHWHLPSLSDASSLNYLFGGSCCTVPTIDDKADLLEMLEGFKTLEIGEADVAALLDVSAALLHAGQITFSPTPDGDGCTLTDSAVVNSAINSLDSLLGISRNSLEDILTKKSTMIAREVIVTARRTESAIEVRDSLSKFLYEKLFFWLVRKINDKIRCDERGLTSIGVLDIFGFECFTNNSFEQLCINYTNEALQQLLIRVILKSDQEEYSSEEISWDAVQYEDNQDCLELIASRNLGIFSMLNDECAMPKGSDSKFASRMYTAYDKSCRFTATNSMKARFLFSIQHFAGPVVYSAESFCEKNASDVPKELKDFLSKFTLSLIRELFEVVSDSGHSSMRIKSCSSKSGSSSSSAPANTKKSSVASEFREELQTLLTKLESTQTTFVRCIKPNDKCEPRRFDRSRVMEQLRCCGIIQAMEVTRKGYPVRLTHDLFLRRYTCICLSFKYEGSSSANCISLINLILQKLKDRDSIKETLAIQVGKTKVFLRQDIFDDFETVRGEAERRAFKEALQASKLETKFVQAAITVQKIFRGNLARFFGS